MDGSVRIALFRRVSLSSFVSSGGHVPRDGKVFEIMGHCGLRSWSFFQRSLQQSCTIAMTAFPTLSCSIPSALCQATVLCEEVRVLLDLSSDFEEHYLPRNCARVLQAWP
eukprot:scaffold36165_cov183-Amphora_coffeaeformis.AAC.3